MGKKGKKSKCNAASKDANKFLIKGNKLMKVASKLHDDCLLSNAADQYRKVIRHLESKKELRVYTTAYILLFTLEYYRRNYNAAIDCLCSMKSSASCTEEVSLYYQLIMLRLSGQEFQLSDFVSKIEQEYKSGNKAIGNFFEEAVFTFRAHKHFESAIRLEMALGSLMRSNVLETKLSLALTYLEQYRIEFKGLQRSKKDIRKNFVRDLNVFITSMQVEYPPNDHRSSEYALVLAQWYYIIHPVFDDDKAEKQLIDGASEMIESYLECASKLLPFQRCFTCDQAVTSTEVQYVCSGCRIARYCSIDHQRMTWKKEAVSGMRIGHEILCPLYKAYRKCTIARNYGDEKKKSRMQRRFRRECRNFLEYGLGLKNKCIPCEYQSLFFNLRSF
ncbi:predicted protein [Chaetoceros tenuissimus]|uniref:MYND-type domain-containing protein n=1 Tax=Chaetoceros tenuissimus TaxID=426638 RepID=A0AAD3D3E1_9STRA|nr:predicted protein [Chaetoceros tenuissimus]